MDRGPNSEQRTSNVVAETTRTANPAMKTVSVWCRMLALSLAASLTAVADLVVLQDGREYKGALIEATADTIVFRQDGGDKRYRRAEVMHLRLQKERPWDGFANVKDLPDPVLKGIVAGPPATPAAYPGAAAVVLYSSTVVRLRTAQTWQQEVRWICAVLKESGESASVQEFVSRRDEDELDVHHAMCVRPDGSLAHLSDSAVQEETVNADLPQYDRLVSRRYALPEGKAGNILDIGVTTVRRQPVPTLTYGSERLFGGQNPVRHDEVKVYVPAGLAFQWQLLNDPDGVVKHTEAKTAEGVCHTWLRTDAPQLLPEPMAAPTADCVPRLVLAAAAKSWEEVARDVDAGIRPLAASAAALKPPVSDVRGLWEQVSRNIQDAGISLEASGYLPGSLADLLRLRRGPALDRAFLLYVWLRNAGVPGVKWCWLRPRSLGQLAREVPSLQAFAQPAVLVDDARQPQLLVPGDDLDTPAECMAEYAGAWCLVAGEGLRQMPLPPPESRGSDTVIDLRLEKDGTAQVTQSVTYRGAEARTLRGWRRLTGEEIRNAVESFARAVDSRARGIRHQVVGDVTANAPAITLEVSYQISEFADVRASLLSARLPWLRYDASAVGRDQRRLPLFWDMPRQDSTRITVHSPAGFPFYAGAEPVTAASRSFQLRATREDTPGTTTFSLQYRRDVIDAPVSLYPEIKDSIQKRAALGRTYWIWRAPP